MFLVDRMSLVQDLVVRVDIGAFIYEAMTPHCGKSVVQVLLILGGHLKQAYCHDMLLHARLAHVGACHVASCS